MNQIPAIILAVCLAISTNLEGSNNQFKENNYDQQYSMD